MLGGWFDNLRFGTYSQQPIAAGPLALTSFVCTEIVGRFHFSLPQTFAIVITAGFSMIFLTRLAWSHMCLSTTMITATGSIGLFFFIISMQLAGILNNHGHILFHLHALIGWGGTLAMMLASPLSMPSSLAGCWPQASSTAFPPQPRRPTLALLY